MRTAMVGTAIGSAVAVTLALGGAVGFAQAPATERPKIEGAWTLNRDIGDRPGRAGGMSDDQGGGHHRGGYGGGGGGGYGGVGGGMRGGGYGGGGGQMSDEQRAEMQRRRNLAREVLTPPGRLNITVDGDVVSFTDEDGRVKKYKTDGKKEKHAFDNGTVETKSKWENGALTIETSLEGGMKFTQSYSLVSDHRELMVQTKMEGGMSRDDDERKPITHYYDDAVEASVPAQ
jgi:hypothetical protein